MRFLLAGLLWCFAFAVQAQDRATLIADTLTIESGSVLIASGHVEVFFHGQYLEASRISYDRAGDRLTIEGPIRLDDGKGTVLIADQASLKADLTEGILTSARLVMDRQLQLAAAVVMRTGGGRYTALRQVVASSCTICQGNPTPLWEIRAKEVVHDEVTHQIYFSSAQLRFYGLPVLWLPHLRVPDPTLNRATGFLLPQLRSTSALGPGLKFPYFITLGQSRDLLVTPYLTSLGNRTVELRYRQAFTHGTLTLNGAISADDLIPNAGRGYLEARGIFDLPRGYTLDFHLIGVSDPAYLLDYGISEADRLDSRIEVTRTQRNAYFSARLIGFQTLREGEDNATLPALVSDLSFHRRFKPAILGGTGGFELQTHSHYRPSTSPLDGDLDGIADGRDLGRVSARADWRRNWVLANGMVGSAIAQLSADYYAIGQDASYAGTTFRAAGTAAVELRWPWVRAGAGGGSQVIEPVLQLVASPKTDGNIPNEDSTLVEFDEGNLFSIDRFPGSDAVEGGLRVNVGLNYLAQNASGWSLGLTAGRVIRLEDPGQFSAASGLSGAMSDWLFAWQLQGARGLSLTNRFLVDDSFALTKGELRLDLSGETYGLAAGYEFVRADPGENRPNPTSELVLDARYDLTRAWSARVTTRYDFDADRTAQAGLAVGFRNECLDFNLSLSRRFTSSTTVKPTTDFGLSVELLGFGGGTSPGPSRVCRR